MKNFDEVVEWEELYEVKGMSLKEVIAWLDKKGVDVKEADCGDCAPYEPHLEEENFDGCLFVDGYWADFSPVIDFEDGRVVRWYRDGAWD